MSPLPPPPLLSPPESQRGPAWVWLANAVAATALLAGGVLLVIRLAVYVANADEHLDYEALGFAQLFGVAGIVLLTPFIFVAIGGVIGAATRSRAVFVCNIIVGGAGIMIARGFGSLSFLVVMPMAAVALGVVGIVVVGGHRGR